MVSNLNLPELGQAPQPALPVPAALPAAPAPRPYIPRQLLPQWQPYNALDYYTNPQTINSLADVLLAPMSDKYTVSDYPDLFKTLYENQFAEPWRQGKLGTMGMRGLHNIGETLDLVTGTGVLRGLVQETGGPDWTKILAGLGVGVGVLLTLIPEPGTTAGGIALLGALAKAGFISGTAGMATAGAVGAIQDPKKAKDVIANQLGMQEKGRENYDWDTGNVFADVALELISDPTNIVGGFADDMINSRVIKAFSQQDLAVQPGIAKGITKALKEGASPTDSAVLNKIMAVVPDADPYKVEDVVRSLLDTLGYNSMVNPVNVSLARDKIELMTQRAALLTSPLLVPGLTWKGIRHGGDAILNSQWYKHMTEMKSQTSPFGKKVNLAKERMVSQDKILSNGILQKYSRNLRSRYPILKDMQYEDHVIMRWLREARRKASPEDQPADYYREFFETFKAKTGIDANDVPDFIEYIIKQQQQLDEAHRTLANISHNPYTSILYHGGSETIGDGKMAIEMAIYDLYKGQQNPFSIYYGLYKNSKTNDLNLDTFLDFEKAMRFLGFDSDMIDDIKRAIDQNAYKSAEDMFNSVWDLPNGNAMNLRSRSDVARHREVATSQKKRYKDNKLQGATDTVKREVTDPTTGKKQIIDQPTDPKFIIREVEDKSVQRFYDTLIKQTEDKGYKRYTYEQLFEILSAVTNEATADDQASALFNQIADMENILVKIPMKDGVLDFDALTATERNIVINAMNDLGNTAETVFGLVNTAMTKDGREAMGELFEIYKTDLAELEAFTGELYRSNIDMDIDIKASDATIVQGMISRLYSKLEVLEGISNESLQLMYDILDQDTPIGRLIWHIARLDDSLTSGRPGHYANRILKRVYSHKNFLDLFADLNDMQPKVAKLIMEALDSMWDVRLSSDMDLDDITAITKKVYDKVKLSMDQYKGQSIDDHLWDTIDFEERDKILDFMFGYVRSYLGKQAINNGYVAETVDKNFIYTIHHFAKDLQLYRQQHNDRFVEQNAQTLNLWLKRIAGIPFEYDDEGIQHVNRVARADVKEIIPEEVDVRKGKKQLTTEETKRNIADREAIEELTDKRYDVEEDLYKKNEQLKGYGMQSRYEKTRQRIQDLLTAAEQRYKVAYDLNPDDDAVLEELREEVSEIREALTNHTAPRFELVAEVNKLKLEARQLTDDINKIEWDMAERNNDLDKMKEMREIDAESLERLNIAYDAPFLSEGYSLGELNVADDGLSLSDEISNSVAKVKHMQREAARNVTSLDKLKWEYGDDVNLGTYIAGYNKNVYRKVFNIPEGHYFHKLDIDKFPTGLRAKGKSRYHYLAKRFSDIRDRITKDESGYIDFKMQDAPDEMVRHGQYLKIMDAYKEKLRLIYQNIPDSRKFFTTPIPSDEATDEARVVLEGMVQLADYGIPQMDDRDIVALAEFLEQLPEYKYEIRKYTDPMDFNPKVSFYDDEQLTVRLKHKEDFTHVRAIADVGNEGKFKRIQEITENPFIHPDKKDTTIAEIIHNGVIDDLKSVVQSAEADISSQFHDESGMKELAPLINKAMREGYTMLEPIKKMAGDLIDIFKKYTPGQKWEGRQLYDRQAAAILTGDEEHLASIIKHYTNGVMWVPDNDTWGALVRRKDDKKLAKYGMKVVPHNGWLMIGVTDPKVYTTDWKGNRVLNKKHEYFSLKKPEGGATGTTDKLVRFQGQGKDAKRVKEFQDSYDEAMYNAITQSDIGDIPVHHESFMPSLLNRDQWRSLEDQFPGMKNIFQLDEGFFNDPRFNFSVIGSYDDVRKLNEFATLNPYKAVFGSLSAVTGKMSARNKYLHIYFNDHFKLKTMPFLSKLSPDKKFEAWQRVKDDYVIVNVREINKKTRNLKGPNTTVFDNYKKGQTRYKVHTMEPKNAEQFQRMSNAGAIMVPKTLYSDMYSKVNNNHLTRGALNTFHKTVIGDYKHMSLQSTGFPFRNALDATYKNWQSSGDLWGSIRWMLEADRLHREADKIQKRIIDLSFSRYGSDTITSKAVRDVMEDVTDREAMQFALWSIYQQTPASGGMLDVLQEYYSALTNGGNLKKGPLVEGYKGVRKWLRANLFTKMIDSANSRIEHAARLGEILRVMDEGGRFNEGVLSAVKNQFDYANKSQFEWYLEMVFPFLTFPRMNLEYWTEKMWNQPRVFNFLYDVDRASWSQGTSTDDNEELYGGLIDYHRSAGNVLYNSKNFNMILKTNPSLYDAIGLMDLKGEAQMRMFGPAQYALRKFMPEGMEENVFGDTDYTAMDMIPYTLRRPYHMVQQIAEGRIPDTSMMTFKMGDQYPGVIDTEPKGSRYFNNQRRSQYARGYRVYPARFQYAGSIYHRYYTSTGKSRMELAMQPVTANNLKYRIKDTLYQFKY